MEDTENFFQSDILLSQRDNCQSDTIGTKENIYQSDILLSQRKNKEDTEDTELDVDKGNSREKTMSTSNSVFSVHLCAFFVKKSAALESPRAANPHRITLLIPSRKRSVLKFIKSPSLHFANFR